MCGRFSSLSTALSALHYNRVTMDGHGSNVANVGAERYAHRRVMGESVGASCVPGWCAPNAGDGVAWLTVIDAAVTSVLDREAERIRAVRLARANTPRPDLPISGDTTVSQEAYDRTTEDCARADRADRERFGAGSDHVLEVLDVLDEVARHLRTDAASRGDDLHRLDAALARMRAAVAGVGTRALRLERAAQTAKDVTLTLLASPSEVRDVETVKATMDPQLLEVAYQAAVATTARTVPPSLLDFLR